MFSILEKKQQCINMVIEVTFCYMLEYNS